MPRRVLAASVVVLLLAGAPVEAGMADRVGATFSLISDDFIQAFNPVEAVVVAARASVSRSPMRFRQAYVISIEDVVEFVTGRRHSLSRSTVLRAVEGLVRPGQPSTDG